MGDTDTIYFYGTNTEHGCFSNFSKHPVTLKGKRWATSEHYFQAQKFAGTPYEEHVRATPSPGQAAKMGRRRDLPLRKDWEKVKEAIMKEVLVAKFTQHDDTKKTLLSTGDKTLVEHTKNDSYWADGGGHGCGKNRLGYLLMEVRDELRASGNIPIESNPAPTSQPTSTTEESKTQEKEQEEDEKEEADEQEEEEKIEGVEPNVNRMYDPGMSAEAKQAGGGKKKAHRGGGSKSRTKRGVFRDADGHSTLEKTNEVRGTVTVIGEGTIFSEKALPPQAKNKHQMQRKYHPTEKDAARAEEDDDEPEQPKKKGPMKKVMADFFKLRTDDESPASVHVAAEESMTAEECMEAAKSNTEVLAAITEGDLRSEVLENLRKIRDVARRFIEEFSETSDDRLAPMMECYTKLEEVLM